MLCLLNNNWLFRADTETLGRHKMRKLYMNYLTGILALVFVVAINIVPASISAAEIVMFESKSCHVCQKWNKEIGPSYNKSDIGKKLPLRQVELHKDRTAGIDLQRGVWVTPTFVIVEKNKEIARIQGYAGRKYFFDTMRDMAELLEDDDQEKGAM